MWLELIWWICSVLIFHQHILLIACEPLLNLMTNYLYVLQGNNGKHWGLQDGTHYYTLPFLFLSPISNIEKIFMHILVFRPFQRSSLMITSQTTSMVRRQGKFLYNGHSSILKCSWIGRRMDGESSTGTSLKLQRPSTWMKAQYSPSASAVFHMRCISLCTVYDANFERF